jgi:hypothetical protein
MCSSCGAGRSNEATQKLEAQGRLFGQPCPVLDCARRNGIDYCLRDCRFFPCDTFGRGPYPFSDGYLTMQRRRRQEVTPARTPYGDVIRVPVAYWEEVEKTDSDALCHRGLVKAHLPRGWLLRFLNEDIWIDPGEHALLRSSGGQWETVDDPLMELMSLVYLRQVGPEPLRNKMVGPGELKDAHFFQGPHALRVQAVLKRYGNDVEGFKKAAETLGGNALDVGDASYALFPFPKVPLYYILWEGDGEFEPRLSVLFDQSIERHLTADAIWGVVNLVSDALIRAT